MRNYSVTPNGDTPVPVDRAFRTFRPAPTATDVLRKALTAFPDRAAFESWLTAKNATDEQRAHLERLLPDRLKAVGSV